MQSHFYLIDFQQPMINQNYQNAKINKIDRLWIKIRK